MSLIKSIKKFFGFSESKHDKSRHDTYPITTNQDNSVFEMKLKMVEKLAKNGYLSEHENSTLQRWRNIK